MDQDRVPFNLTAVDLNALIGQFVADRVPLAESRGLNLITAFAPDTLRVQADRGLLEQVLSVLLTNTFNYTPPGGQVTVRTHVRQAADQRWAGFSVSDTGPGIPKEEQSKLFTRFFRGQAGRKSGVSGTGLGLAIARVIVDRHGGQITVESEGVASRGATFTVWLRAAALPEPDTDDS
jgi:signal transduction histidine kinase